MNPRLMGEKNPLPIGLNPSISVGESIDALTIGLNPLPIFKRFFLIVTEL